MKKNTKNGKLLLSRNKNTNWQRNSFANTTLRKKYRGKWYLWTFLESRFLKDSNLLIENEITSVKEKLHKQVYFALVCGEINLKLNMIANDKPVFVIDPDQKTETERLVKQYNLL